MILLAYISWVLEKALDLALELALGLVLIMFSTKFSTVMDIDIVYSDYLMSNWIILSYLAPTAWVGGYMPRWDG